MVREGLLRWTFSNCIKAVNTIKMREIYHNELMHYGIKGQKWGVRRFQNEDRTLTEAGKRRYRSDAFDRSNSNLGPSKAKNIARSTQNALNSASAAAKTAGRMSSNRSRKDSPSKRMSDEELRKAISRIELERRYDSLTSSNTSRGMDYVGDILSIAGGIAGVAVSGITIYSLLKK